MNIILQNYKNLITNLIIKHFNNNLEALLKDLDGFSINNYLSIISNFDSNMNSFICESLVELINELDSNFSKSKERISKYHIKDYKKRTILTIFGEITYYRHYYKSKLNGSSFCFVDRFLGLQKYDYFDPYIKSEILDYASENNYSETAKHINALIGNRISIDEKTKYINRQTVRNVILNAKISKPKYESKNEIEELYIIADEKWIPTQNNKNKKIMQKSLVVFDGFNKDGKRKSLNNKMTFSGSNHDFIFDSINYIEKSYKTSKIKRIFIMGDGATWIDNLKYYFNYNKNTEVIQGLDHFHLKQCLWRIMPEKDVYDELVRNMVNDNKDDFERIIDEIIDLNTNRKEKIDEYKRYILNHWSSILNLFKYNLSCPMESQISHTFASYFTSRPKGYSKTTLPKLIELRLLKKNKYNIKKLFFNNLNHAEIIDLNKKQLDFSMFDRNELYTTTHDKLNNALAI